MADYHEQHAIDSVDQPSPGDGGDDALETIWSMEDRVDGPGYSIRRRCIPLADSDRADCSIVIFSNGKKIREFHTNHSYQDWLKFGFFDFLKTGRKQLIVHTYSGGAHCCYDYVIFDLYPTVRLIYDTAEFDSANEIGNRLVPVDIDGDGVFEFYQDVMAFDYVGHGGHATATFPPAIFSFDRKAGRFVFANKAYPEFVLSRLNETLNRLTAWRTETNKYGGSVSETEMNEVVVRERFLHLVYGGKRDEAWDYFKVNYRTDDGNAYQDRFRDQFVSEFEQRFSKDPTYLSIYGR